MLITPIVLSAVIYKWMTSSFFGRTVDTFFLEIVPGAVTGESLLVTPTAIIDMLPHVTILWAG